MSTKIKRMTGSLLPAKINKDIIKMGFRCVHTNRPKFDKAESKTESLFSFGSVRKFTNVEIDWTDKCMIVRVGCVFAYEHRNLSVTSRTFNK